MVSRLVRALNNVFGNKFNVAFLKDYGGGYTNYDANNITYLEKGYNINPIVYSIVQQQASKTASVPFYIKRIKDKQALQKRNAILQCTNNDLSIQQKVKVANLENKALDGELLPLPLEVPNVHQGWSQFLALYKTFLTITGNAYLYILKARGGLNGGEPIQVYLLPSHLMQIVLKEKTSLLLDENPVKSYILTYGRNFIEFEAENVIHIKYPNPNYDENGGHLYGISRLRSALKNIQTTNTGLDLNIKTLKSGGAFGLIHGKTQPLRKEQADEIKSRLLEMRASTEELANIAGVSAEVGFTRLSLSTAELQLFDYFNFDQKQIANVLGWSDKLLNNDAASTYDNIIQERKRVVTDNILPDLNLLQEALNRYFLPQFKNYKNTILEFDISELPEMQTDISEMVKWLETALKNGVITRNEFREAINYAKVEDKNMDFYTVQNDIMTLEEAIDSTFGLRE